MEKFDFNEIENNFCDTNNKNVENFKSYVDSLFRNKDKSSVAQITNIFLNNFPKKGNIYKYLTNDINDIIFIINNNNNLILYKNLINAIKYNDIELLENILYSKKIKDIEKFIIGIMNSPFHENNELSDKCSRMILQLVETINLNIKIMIKYGLLQTISRKLEYFKIFFNKYPYILNKKSSNDQNILDYAVNYRNFELVEKILFFLKPNTDLNLLNNKEKQILLRFSNSETMSDQLKQKIIESLFKDANKYLFEKSNLTIGYRKSNQVVFYENFVYDKNINKIEKKDIAFANLKNKEQKNIKLYDITFNKNNKVVTYYKYGTNEVLATLLIYKNKEFIFDFGEGKGKYDDPNFKEYIAEIFNADFESLNNFDYVLSCLSFVDLQYRQHRIVEEKNGEKILKKENKKYIYITSIIGNQEKAKILNESLKEPNKTFIYGFSVPSHTTQAIVSNGNITILNTGGGKKNIYGSIKEIIKELYKLNPEKEEIKNLYNKLTELEKFDKSEEKIYEEILEYMRNNKSPIKIVHFKNISQSTGNCSLASRINMSILATEYYIKYGEFNTLSERLNKLDDLFKKMLMEEKYGNIIECVNNVSEEEIELIKIISRTNDELLKKKKHFKNSNCNFYKMKVFIENRENLKIKMSEYEKMLKTEIDNFKQTLTEEENNMLVKDKNNGELKLINKFLEKNYSFSIYATKPRILMIYIKNGHIGLMEEYIKELDKYMVIIGKGFKERRNYIIGEFYKCFKNNLAENNIYYDRVVKKFKNELLKLDMNNYEKILNKFKDFNKGNTKELILYEEEYIYLIDNVNKITEKNKNLELKSIIIKEMQTMKSLRYKYINPEDFNNLIINFETIKNLRSGY